MLDTLELKQQNFSFLGKNSTIKGEFHLSGVVKISSYLEGELTMTPDSTLTIERSGKFEGVINCYNMEIHGEVIGTIVSQGKVTVHPSAFVQGKIRANTLTVFPGAQLNIDGHTEDLEET